MLTSDTRPLVVDASIGIALVRREPNYSEVRRVLGDPRYRGARLLVPSFFWLEVLNVLVRRYGLTPEVVLEAVAELDALDLEAFEVDRPMLLLALDMMARHGLAAYDAVYVAMAGAADAELLTADVQMATAAGSRARLVGSGGGSIRESRAPYASTTWADWPGAATYLKELRARAMAGG